MKRIRLKPEFSWLLNKKILKMIELITEQVYKGKSKNLTVDFAVK